MVSVSPSAFLRSLRIKAALPLVGVCLLTVAGLAIRLQGLRGPDGALGIDESRLALAAQGVLATGLPTVPSGRVYTRGLISSYLMAPSLWLFGRHDFAARLPSVVVGTLLIPVVFVFGRAVAGPAAGLCAAAFAMVHPQLVAWSTQAWMPALFVLVFVGAAYLLYLGYGHDRPTLQLAGAAGFVVALLVYELAVLLPMAVLATLALRAARRDFAWLSGRRSVVALGLFGLGLLLLVALGMALRMGTIAGSGAEFSNYLIPTFTYYNLWFYYHFLLRNYLLLLVAAALGALLLYKARDNGILFLYVLMAVGTLTLGFLVNKTMERYGLMLLPVLAIIAAWALVEGARLVAGRWKIDPSAVAVLPAAALVLAFALSVRGDLGAAVRPREFPARTWLSTFAELGPAPEDLVLSDVPTIVAFYRGRVDYWARNKNYERYGYRVGGEIRDIYTNALRLNSDEDFLRVANANPGRIFWYVGRMDRFLDHDDAFRGDLRARLLQVWDEAKRTADGWVILRIDLGAVRARLE